MCGIGRVPNWKTILVQKLPLSSFIAPLGGRKGHGTPSTVLYMTLVVQKSWLSCWSIIQNSVASGSIITPMPAKEHNIPLQSTENGRNAGTSRNYRNETFLFEDQTFDRDNFLAVHHIFIS
jgi:hypothetical protein